MNSSMITSGTTRLSSISVFTRLSLMREGSVPPGLAYTPSSSWRKFIHKSALQSGYELTMMVVPLEKTTTEGPTVLKPTSIEEDYDVRGESFFRFLDELESGAYAADDISIAE